MAHIPHWHFYLDQLLKKLLKHNNRASLRAKWNKNWGTQLSTNPRGRTTESRRAYTCLPPESPLRKHRICPGPVSAVPGAHCPILPTLRPPWQNSGSCLPRFRCHANSPDPDMFDISTIYICIWSVHLITLHLEICTEKSYNMCIKYLFF